MRCRKVAQAFKAILSEGGGRSPSIAYGGHSLELVRNNWDKTLKLLIDGQEVAAESRILPHNITLTAVLEHAGVPHTVVARSVVHFPTTEDTLEVDGQALTLTKTR